MAQVSNLYWLVSLASIEGSLTSQYPIAGAVGTTRKSGREMKVNVL